MCVSNAKHIMILFEMLNYLKVNLDSVFMNILLRRHLGRNILLPICKFSYKYPESFNGEVIKSGSIWNTGSQAA